MNKLYWLLLAAASGAFVGCGLEKSLTSWKARFVFFTSGLACAFWLVGPLARAVGISDPDAINAITFCFAAFWPKVLARVAEAIDVAKLPGFLRNDSVKRDE